MDQEAEAQRSASRTTVASQKPRWLRVVGWLLAGGSALVVLFLTACLIVAWRPLGKKAEGRRLERMVATGRWQDEHFIDVMPRQEPDLWKILPKWLDEPHPYRRPAIELPHESPTARSFETPPRSGLRITWLGHSTSIIELDGTRILTDPIWGEYVAPLPLKNARRFLPPPLPFEELPPIDVVLISHDHYDHLDTPTIERLATETNVHFVVPLGIGAHLEYWGVAPERITELFWWEETKAGDVRLVCTPARHFSGRSLVDKDKTLWASWALLGPAHRVYFSGDTALFPGFKRIGEQFGPFDVTMIETGAYNALWADVHLGPEQAIVAHQWLRGKVLLPIHWGMFDLGLHGWTEPIERTLVAARKARVPVATLRPGAQVEPTEPLIQERWWPERPWQTAEEAPIHSSGM